MISKLFRRSRLVAPTLVNSKLFDETTFYPAFMRDLKRCQRELIIESPFLTTKRVGLLVPTFANLVQQGVRVVVNTRIPEEHEDYLYHEAERSISLLHAHGVTVLFTGGHHRKLVVIDREVLYEGSLNILSQNDSCEIMRRIESVELVRQMVRFIKLDRFLT